jgi:hypothetical protein
VAEGCARCTVAEGYAVAEGRVVACRAMADLACTLAKCFLVMYFIIIIIILFFNSKLVIHL